MNLLKKILGWQQPLYQCPAFFSTLIFTAFAAYILITFQHYGASNDEMVQHTYGQLLLNYYASGLQDLSAFHYKNLFLYGGLFDLIAAALENWVPWSVWDLRHLLSALFAWVGMVAVYRSAYLLANARAACWSILLLALTAAWSGAMFTHTKDVTFAACMAWVMFYSLRMAQDLRHIPFSLSVKLGIALGLAIGLRIGGVFGVLELAIVILIGMWRTKHLPSAAGLAAYCLLALIPAAVVSAVISIFCWPWVVMGSQHLWIAVQSFSHFSFNMNTVVNGAWVNIGEVPRSYLLQYLLLRLPELFLLSLLLALVYALVDGYRAIQQRQAQALARIALIVIVAFPLLFVWWDKPALYNGIRHFTFILPALAVWAGIALDRGLQQPRSSRIQSCLLSACVISLAYTLCILVRLYPYQYTYYNALAGDYAHAQQYWESDYWSSSTREASQRLMDFVQQEQSSQNATQQPSYSVALCAEAFQGEAYLDHRFHITEDWRRADFFISSTHMNCDTVLQGERIAEIKRFDTTLAVVKDRRQLQGDARTPRPAQRPH